MQKQSLPVTRQRLPRLRVVLSVVVLLAFSAIAVKVWITNRQEHAAARRIREYGGIVRYDWQPTSGDWTGRSLPLLDPDNVHPVGPAWLRGIVGDGWFEHVERISLVMGKATDETVACLRDLPRLRAVFLYGEQLSDDALDDIGTLANVEELDLGRSNITDTGVAKFKGLRSLRVIHLDGTQITDAALRSLSEMPSLEEVYLDGTAVGDDGVRYLVGLRELKALGLPRTHLTDDGLASLAKLASLRSLMVGENSNITDDGLRALKSLSSLQALDVGRTRIGDDGLRHLQSMTELECLCVYNTLVTEKGIKLLKVALPRLKAVSWSDAP